VQDAMRRADPSGGLEKCWQGKELVRKLLKLASTNPDHGQIFNVLVPAPSDGKVSPDRPS